MAGAAAWPTVLVLGPTGAGKTSLLQAIYGDALVPEERIGHGRPATQHFEQYALDGMRIYDSRGLEPGDYELHRRELAEFLSRTGRHADLAAHVHVVWYAIPGPGARVIDADLKTIKDMPAVALVLITKADITRPDQLRGMTDALVRRGVAPEHVIPCSIGDRSKLDARVERTEALFPSTHRRIVQAAAEAQRKARQEAQRIIAAGAKRAAPLDQMPAASAVLIGRIEQRVVEDLATCFRASDRVTAFWDEFGQAGRQVDWKVLAVVASPWLTQRAVLSSPARIRATGAAAMAYFSSSQKLPREALAAIALQATRSPS